LIDNSKKEKYYEGIKEQIQSLKDKIYHNKELDLQTFKSEIKEILENEIVSRYYLQKGIVEASFDNDEDIKAAVDLFKDEKKYSDILSTTAVKKQK
jgi:carboxyl-terminal processing protease